MANIINTFTFREALIISLSVFFADWMSGIAAALRSDRHLKSSVMRQSLSDKAVKYFHFVLIGLAFAYSNVLHDIAPVVVMIPAIPEVLSLFENIQIIKTKIDTKPKEENENENN